jgi:hypothetical protein
MPKNQGGQDMSRVWSIDVYVHCPLDDRYSVEVYLVTGTTAHGAWWQQEYRYHRQLIIDDCTVGWSDMITEYWLHLKECLHYHLPHHYPSAELMMMVPLL